MQEAQAELDGPPFPAWLAYVLEWYEQLARRRGPAGFGGMETIGWAQLNAWSRMTGIRPDAFELEGLAQLDAAFFRVLAEK